MKQLNTFIQEKLKITSKTEINKIKNYENFLDINNIEYEIENNNDCKYINLNINDSSEIGNKLLSIFNDIKDKKSNILQTEINEYIQEKNKLPEKYTPTIKLSSTSINISIIKGKEPNEVAINLIQILPPISQDTINMYKQNNMTMGKNIRERINNFSCSFMSYLKDKNNKIGEELLVNIFNILLK